MPTHGREAFYMRCLWQRIHPRRQNDETRRYTQEESGARGRWNDVTTRRVLARSRSSSHLISRGTHTCLILSLNLSVQSLVKQTNYNDICKINTCVKTRVFSDIQTQIPSPTTLRSDLALMPYYEVTRAI